MYIKLQFHAYVSKYLSLFGEHISTDLLFLLAMEDKGVICHATSQQENWRIAFNEFKELFKYVMNIFVAVRDIVICDDVSASHVRYVKETLESTVGSERV